MLFVPPILDLDGQCGDWAREELEEMNRRFVEALEKAFEAGLESRAAAAATVRLESSLNGSRRLAEEAAIGAAWRFFVDAKFDVSAAAIVARVQASCSSVAVEQIREEFKRRLFSRVQLHHPMQVGSGP